jgi:hypothetical protein
MQYPNPTLWLAWALFGTFFVLLLWKKYLPAVRQMPDPVALPATEAAKKAPPCWLFCEDGTSWDRRVQWFALRPGGRSVVGARPRKDTPESSFLYLTAEDVREDHAVISYDAQGSRYRVEACGGARVLHNNEPLEAGHAEDLADGDTLDLGHLSRFRFTLTGPEAS